jgi:hypothetical protein
MTNNRLFSHSHGCRAMLAMTIVLLMLFFTTLGFSQNVPTLVKDVAVGTANSQLRSLVALNTKAYFVANNGSDKLYQTDGTTNGTSQVTGYTDDVTSNIVAWNGQIYFTTKRANATQGTRILLYKTSGTTAVFVDTLFNNTTSTSTDGYNLTRLYVENNQLLYNLQTLYYQGSSISLSSHNGLRNGAKLITGVGFDSRSGGATTYSQSSVFVGTNTFYAYEEGGSFGNNSIGKALIVVRNTSPVSERIIFQRGWFTSNPPPADFQFTALGVIGDFFYAINKDTLFRYDSTGLRTLIKTGVGPFVGFRPIKVGNQLYIKDGNNDLWRTDGTAAGTIKLARTGLQPTEILGDLFTDGTDLYIKTIIAGVFPGLRRVIGNAITSGFGGTGQESSNGDPIFANGKIYFTTSPNSPCTIGLIEYNPTTSTNQYFPLVTQANCSQSIGTNLVVLPNNVLLLDFATAATGLELFKLDLNPPVVPLPDFSIRISNLRVNTSQVGTPRDPYSTPTSLDYVITASNLDLTDTRPLNVRAYVSNDSIFSADDAPLVFQSLSQRDLPFNLITNGIPVSLRTAGLKYIFLKIDSENGVVEANENNNVSNPLSVDVYAVSCASNGVNPYSEWVSNVKLNTINNTSEKTRYGNIFGFQVGYSNFLDVSTTLNKGQSYPLSITPSLGYPTYPTNLFTRVWIDYNQNGIFEDAEIVLAKNGNQVATQNFTVPNTALTGTTAMRVSLKAGAYPTACEVFDKGEVEDYTITIQAATVTPLPDLTIQNFILTTPSVRLGETIYYTVDAKNIGTANTTQGNIQSYLSLDRVLDATDLVIGSIAFFIPPVGQTITGLQGGLSTISLGTAGNYYIIVKIDPDNTIAESNENNNVIVSTTTVTINPVVNNSCRYQDSLQLVSLYNATNGANWTNKWNLATPINTWYGVSLNANGCVESLASPGNNLVGTLPNLNLQSVLTLALPNNLLSGSVPNLNLPNVTQLILYNNKFTGTLPNFTLPNVVNLDLSVNLLTGVVPSLNLPKLVNLTLNTNKFSGTIPSFTLPKLEQLNLFDNALTGTIPNFNLPNLKNLILQTNKLMGSIPTFAGTPIIVQVELSNNLLSGCLPVYLQPLCGKTVNIANNPGLFNQNFATFCSNGVGSCEAPLPDFRMTSITQAQGSDLTTTTYPPVTGGFGFNYTVVNSGGAYVSPVTAFFYLSKDTILDSRDSLFTKLLAGATGTFLAGGPVPNLPDGDYYLIGKANGDNAIPETNATNNVFVLKTPTVKIRSANVSDLNVLLSTDRGFYQPFTTLTYLLVVENRGTTPFSNIKVEFKFPANTVSGGTAVPTVGTWQEWCAGGVQCYTWTIPAIAAGANAKLNVPLFILNTSAPIVATAKLLSSTPVDANTVNNSATFTINKAPAPTTQPLAFQVPTQQVPVVIQRIAPNPTEGDVIVKLDSWKEQEVDFNFSDITGKTIHSEKRQLDKGVNKVQFDLYHLPQGVYFIQTNVGKGTNVPTKFVKM